MTSIGLSPGELQLVSLSHVPLCEFACTLFDGATPVVLIMNKDADRRARAVLRVRALRVRVGSRVREQASACAFARRCAFCSEYSSPFLPTCRK